jgi:hypothetical protein
MRAEIVRGSLTAVLAVTLLVAGGCGSGGGAQPSADRPTPPSTGTSTGAGSAATQSTPLDGTWEATITRKAFVGYAVDRGVRRRDALAMVEVDLPGSEFSLRFLDGSFNLTGPTGESWNSGRFEVHGDELHVLEPGSSTPFRLAMRLDGERLRLEVIEGQGDGREHLPGVPDIVAGGAIYCSVPWVRVSA